MLTSSASAPTEWYAEPLAMLRPPMGVVGSSPSSGSAKGSDIAVTGRDMAESLGFDWWEARLAM